MLVVDSTVWIDYFNGQVNPHTDYLDAAFGMQSILVGDIILGEVLQGFRRATFCIENYHLLLHRDGDFDPFEQHLALEVVHP